MAKHSTGTEVRAWGLSATLPEGVAKPGEGRGRLSGPLVEAFNAAHPRAKYVPASKAPASTVEVKFKRDPEGKGRTVSKRVVVADARAFALAKGEKVGPRGTLAQSILAEYARTL